MNHYQELHSNQDSYYNPKPHQKSKPVAYFHLPGLFEFYEFYKVFLALFNEHREYFYDWCEIGSIYGAPADCLWGGGRVGYGEDDPADVATLMQRYGISARLTFSNSLLGQEHLADVRCNRLCELFALGKTEAADSKILQRNGVIVHSDLLLTYLQERYPEFYFVSSTTKVLTDFDDFEAELNRGEFAYVVPDFRLNKRFDELGQLSQQQKDKIEFLCNECCDFGCVQRRECYETVSRKSLGISEPSALYHISLDARHQEGSNASESYDDLHVHTCASPYASEGYRFSRAMENPAFISVDDIQSIYLPMGFSNFKIEGRSLGSAVLLEFILHYMTKPECQLKVREEIYLDSSLDLF